MYTIFIYFFPVIIHIIYISMTFQMNTTHTTYLEQGVRTNSLLRDEEFAEFMNRLT